MRYLQICGLITQLNLASAIAVQRFYDDIPAIPGEDVLGITIRPQLKELESLYDPNHVNLTQCFEVFRAGGFGGVGSVYRNGTAIPKGEDTMHATCITYDACATHCGNSIPETTWFDFSQDISAWLLPWLALISQLPFGANSTRQNIDALILYIGSPALSAYSLVLTLLNHYYVTSRFSAFTYPNAHHAARILSDLQQVRFVVNTDGALLASLVVLPHNDQWFQVLRKSLKCGHGWSPAALASIMWVMMTYAFIVSDTLIDIPRVIQQGASGQTLGLIWLWLQLTPKCDSALIETALAEANEKAWIAASPEVLDSPILLSSVKSLTQRYAIDYTRPSMRSFADEDCSIPIFNYARIFSWSQAVEKMADAYGVVSWHREGKLPVRQYYIWKDKEDRGSAIHPDNRLGNRNEVVAYCTLAGNSRKDSLGCLKGPRIAPRMLLAALLGLALQWLTVAGAIIVAYYTPTTGFSCDASAFLLFGILGSLVFFLVVGSGVLAHSVEGTTWTPPNTNPPMAKRLARLLRHTGRYIAVFNLAWLILISFFQFTGAFRGCFCTTISKGSHAHTTSFICESTQEVMVAAWRAGILLAVLTVCAFFIVMKLFMNYPKGKKNDKTM